MHFDSETVLDLIDGTMGEAERGFWMNHLEGCGQCERDLSDWSGLARSVRGSHLIDAPHEAISYAKSSFGRSRETLEIRPFVKQVVATLIFDTGAQPTMAGVRGPGAAGQVSVRQMVLRAAEFDLRIRISAFEDRRDLFGQILPLGSKNFVGNMRLQLRKGEDRISAARANELGEFKFDDIPEGMLSLQIDLPHLTVISALAM